MNKICLSQKLPKSNIEKTIEFDGFKVRMGYFVDGSLMESKDFQLSKEDITRIIGYWDKLKDQ